MTEVYISKISDRTENFTEAFIEESDTPTSVENIQFCHLVTVEAESHVPQALEVGDSPVTVGDSGDSAEIKVEKISLKTEPAQFAEQTHPPKTSPPTASEFKAGDRVQVRADYITPELCGQQAVVVKYFEDDDRYQIDFGRKIKTPFVEPKRFFYMNQKYFHHVTDGEQLEMPF
jgi:hypothetical protein